MKSEAQLDGAGRRSTAYYVGHCAAVGKTPDKMGISESV